MGLQRHALGLCGCGKNKHTFFFLRVSMGLRTTSLHLIFFLLSFGFQRKTPPFFNEVSAAPTEDSMRRGLVLFLVVSSSLRSVRLNLLHLIEG